MKIKYDLAAQFASAALISFAGIGESIAQHNVTGRERRENNFFDVLYSGREHQGQFSFCREARSFRIEQKLPNFFAGRRAPRLPRYSYRRPALAQLAAEAFQLSALAAPIESFKSDELAAPGTHAGDDTRLLRVTIIQAG